MREYAQVVYHNYASFVIALVDIKLVKYLKLVLACHIHVLNQYW